jgi:hypothetical protein
VRKIQRALVVRMEFFAFVEVQEKAMRNIFHRRGQYTTLISIWSSSKGKRLWDKNQVSARSSKFQFFAKYRCDLFFSSLIF